MDLVKELAYAGTQVAVLSMEAAPAALGFWLWTRSRFALRVLLVVAAPLVVFFLAALCITVFR